MKPLSYHQILVSVRVLSLAMAALFISAQISLAQNPPEHVKAESENQVVEVRTGHDHMNNRHQFLLSTKEIPSGWTTFRLANSTSYDHFFLLYKIPEKAIEEAGNHQIPVLEYWEENVTKPFQDEFNPYIKGDINYEAFVENLVGKISNTAPWFFDPGAPTMGGAGFTSSGNASQTTLNLNPGQYLLECYIKDENENFHSYLGMTEVITVNGNRSSQESPQATAKVVISSGEGIKIENPAKSGHNIVEIFFKDQSVYEHLLGHNVQLVKLGDRTDQQAIDELARWMDWTKPGSLIDQAPHGATFLGGTMEMQEGASAYFHVELLPGQYAWIAEVPDPQAKKMFVRFSIK